MTRSETKSTHRTFLSNMSQKYKLREFLSDGKPHRTDEIVREVYGQGLSLARVGARIFDLKVDGFRTVGWKDAETPSLYWYAHVPFYMEHLFDENIKLGMKNREAWLNAYDKMNALKMVKQNALI